MLIKSHPTIATSELIRLLNPKLQGWGNYYRHSIAKNKPLAMLHIDGVTTSEYLTQLITIPIKQHTKVRCDAAPYDPAFTSYWRARKKNRAKSGNRAGTHRWKQHCEKHYRVTQNTFERLERSAVKVARSVLEESAV